MRLRLAYVFAAVLALSLGPAAFANQAFGARGQASHGASLPCFIILCGLGVASQLGGLRVAGVDRRSLRFVLSQPASWLVSGGEVLLRIAASGVPADRVSVRRDRTDVTSDFKLQPDGTLLGLVGGLSLGRNEIVARSEGGGASSVVVVNDHPSTGPGSLVRGRRRHPDRRRCGACTYSAFPAPFSPVVPLV